MRLENGQVLEDDAWNKYNTFEDLSQLDLSIYGLETIYESDDEGELEMIHNDKQINGEDIGEHRRKCQKIDEFCINTESILNTSEKSGSVLEVGNDVFKMQAFENFNHKYFGKSGFCVSLQDNIEMDSKNNNLKGCSYILSKCFRKFMDIILRSIYSF